MYGGSFLQGLRESRAVSEIRANRARSGGRERVVKGLSRVWFSSAFIAQTAGGRFEIYNGAGGRTALAGHNSDDLECERASYTP